MEKLIALAAATILSTSTAALATGMSEGSTVSAMPASAAAKAPPSAIAKTGLKGSKLADAVEPAATPLANAAKFEGAKLAAKAPEDTAVAAIDDRGIEYSVPPGQAVTGPDKAEPLTMTARIEAKDISLPAPSPFGEISASELAAVQKSGDVEAMGGPIDAADFVAEGWDGYDADADGGLTRLEFANWVASDADKEALATEAIEERDSAAPDSATVRLLNGTSLEFTAADTDDDMLVSAEELSAYMEA